MQNTEYGLQAYAKGHIPGALFMHADNDLSGPVTGRNGRHPLPDVATIAARLSACGVGPDTQVVAYDNEGGIFASRLWWTLRWLGHDKVAVLDGCLPGWRRAKLPLETETRPRPAAQFEPRPRDIQVDTAYVLSNLRAPQMLLLDARSEERYAGQNETLDPVGGHIPGALNRFYFDNLDDAGCYFKPADELRAEFDGHSRRARSGQRRAAMRFRRHRLPQSAGDGDCRPDGVEALCRLVERMVQRSFPSRRDWRSAGITL